MLDIDWLKAVNDILSHPAGDDCLRALARAIRATCRGSDRGDRVGGDEFAVILDNTRARVRQSAADVTRIQRESRQDPQSYGATQTRS